MSTAELIQHLKHIGNADRLAVIEAASRLIRDDLAAAQEQDTHLRDAAANVKDLYDPGGKLTEWTSLDAEEVIDGPGSR